ncbi:hypothetical protein HPB49_013545 [Dermacentor silvarum]|uniref:Uncharacterized protein n=1 Tax=Dermacentor silvarum TaxID=543639 RepID=A0ACB8D5Q4_DERSI|nr:hypothetical protein HPB49_013545 [Dermacentor silvarum]
MHNCSVQGIERLALFTFGKTHRPVTLTCNRVSIALRSQHSTNETTIDALEVPEASEVNSPLVDGAIITMMTNLGFVPADASPVATTFREDEISIMIGSDFYWGVVTGQMFRILPQVTAMEACFGWTFQGTLLDFSQGSTVQSTSLVFGTGKPPRDDAPTKSPKAKKFLPSTRLSKRNRRGSRTFPGMVSRTPDGNSTTSTSMTIANYVKKQVYKLRPFGMNAGAQRCSKHKRKHTHCSNATLSLKGTCEGRLLPM